MSSFLFSLNAVLPVFFLILLGAILKRFSLINDSFIGQSSLLVFKVALPALIFRTVSQADFQQIYDGREVLAVVLVVTLGFLLIFAGARIFIREGAVLGAFVQCSFRSNTAIIGLAVIANVFGETGLAKAAIPMVFIFPMYNVYSVLSLALSMKGQGAGRFSSILKSIFTNPLIIAVLISLPFTMFSITVPVVADTFLSYVSRMALPLGLLGVGGSLNFKALKERLVPVLFSSGLKIIIYPLVTALVLIWMGISGESLGVIVILMGCPTAISSYVMSEAMGADSLLAAGVIAVTTLGSILSLGTGIFLLRSFGFI